VTVAKFVVLLTAVVLAASGQLLLKHGMSNAQHTSKQTGQGLLLVAARSPWVLGGLAIFALSAVAWLLTLAHVPLTVAYPFNAAGYVCILVASSVILHERTNVWMWIGTVLVGTGLAVVLLTAPLSARTTDTIHRGDHPAGSTVTQDSRRDVP
jgi:drug/metabolite transporter (DMT)-like permease